MGAALIARKERGDSIGVDHHSRSKLDLNNVRACFRADRLLSSEANLARTAHTGRESWARSSCSARNSAAQAESAASKASIRASRADLSARCAARSARTCGDERTATARSRGKTPGRRICDRRSRIDLDRARSPRSPWAAARTRSAAACARARRGIGSGSRRSARCSPCVPGRATMRSASSF